MAAKSWLEMLELEEWVGRRWHRWASGHTSYPSHPAASVRLADVQTAVAVFFRLSGGDAGVVPDAIDARTSSHRLGWRQRLGFDREPLARARLDEEHLLLPVSLDLFPRRELNRALYFWLAAYLACARPPAVTEDPMQRDLLALAEARRACRRALARWPGLAVRYSTLCAELLPLRPRRSLPPDEAALEALIRQALGDSAPLPETAAGMLRDLDAGNVSCWRGAKGYRPPLPVPLWGDVVTLGTFSGVEGGGADDGEEDGEEDTDVTGDGPEGRRAAKRRPQQQSERDDPLVFNRFEKILSIAEMVDLNRLVDDEKDKDASRSAQQLEELAISRHRKKAAARLRLALDLPPGTATGAPLTGRHTYPEWDYRRGAHLPDQCVVLAGPHGEERDGPPPGPGELRRIRQVQRQFEALRPGRTLLRGQLDGSDLDTDAAVRSRCDIVATGAGEDGIYLAALPRARDLAVDILVDRSLSTEAWLEDQRVIDVARQALLALAHGLDRCGDCHAIHSFTSRRREQVWVSTLKDFDEPLGERVIRRIRALEPGQYTRMGAAIRHCTALLATRPQRHRLLLVVGDGKPNDTDYYEGRYAVEDTRRAIREARRQEIRVFGITVDRDAADYAPRLYGRGGWAQVRRPEHLPEALPAIYRQVTGR